MNLKLNLMLMRCTSVINLLIVLLLSAFQNVEAQWTKTNGPPGANLIDIERDGSGNMYLLTVNRILYKSTNNASTWSKVNIVTPAGGLEFTDILVSGTSLYGLSYSAVWVSTDGGSNWTQKTPDNQRPSYVYRLLKYGPDNFLAAWGDFGIYLSKDDGATWAQIFSKQVPNHYFYNNVVASTAAGDLYAISATEGIIKYAYPGLAGSYNPANWQIVVASSSSYEKTVVVDANDKIYVAGNFPGPDIKVSNNGAAFVSAKGNLTTQTSFGGILGRFGTAIYFSNANLVEFYVTTNGGGTWTVSQPPQASYGADVTCFAFKSATEIFVGTAGAGVFSSTNSGSTFSLAMTGGPLEANGSSIEISNTGRWLETTSWANKGYWTSTDNGANWIFTTLSDNIRRFKKLSATEFLAYGTNTVFKSTDGGATFPNAYNYTMNIISSGPTATLYGVGDWGSTIKSSGDGGVTWSSIGAITGLPGAPNGYSFSQDYFAVDGSTNFFVPVNNNNNGKLELYKISGTAASKLSINFDNTSVTGLFVLNSKLYVGTDNAIYVSSDAGATWSTINFGGMRVSPITQNTYTGIAVSKWESFYVTQDEGKSWNSSALPKASWIPDFRIDATGAIVACTLGGPVIKNTTPLLVDPITLPTYIDFNWQQMAGPYGTFAGHLFKDFGGNLYAFSRLGNPIYKTSNLNTWTKINDYSTDFHTTAVNTTNGDLFEYFPNNLYKSVNGGSNWTSINTENIGSKEVSVAPNGDIILLDGYGNPSNPAKLYVSTNGGASFGAPKFTYNGWLTGGFFADANGNYYYQFWDSDQNTERIAFSTNRGSNWNFMTIPAGISQTGLDASGNLYCVKNNDVFKSTNLGVTWISIKGNIQEFSTNSNSKKVWFSPAGEIWFSASAQDPTAKKGFFKSADNGANWTFVPHPLTIGDVYDVQWLGATAVIATEDGVFKSTDGGATLTLASNGILSKNERLALLSQNRLLVSNFDILNETNDFQSWHQRTPTLYGYITKPDGTQLAWDLNKLYRTDDGGATWIPISKLTVPWQAQHIATNGSTFFLTCYNPNSTQHEIYYSSDLNTWTQLQPLGFPSNFGLNSIAVANDGTPFITGWNIDANKSEAYRIRYGTAQKIPNVSNPGNVQLHNGLIYLYDGAGVIFTTTTGQAWNQISAPNGANLIISNYKEYFFVSQGSGGLWLSRNQGQSWQDVGLGPLATNNFIQDVVVNEFNGYAYAAVDNAPIMRSNGIVIPQELINPGMSTFSPANLATNVSVKPKLTITFDEAVVPVAGMYLKILDVNNLQSPVASFEVNTGIQSGRSFTFIPPTALSYSKSYYVAIDAGAFVDIFNNQSAEITTEWRFTTKASPTVTLLNPSSGATNVNANTKLTVTFSEIMTPVVSKNLNVYDASQTSTPVATISKSKSSYSTANDYVVLDPVFPTPDEPVTIYFNAAVGGKQLMGLPLDQDVYLHTGVIIDGTFPDGGPQGSLWTNDIFEWGTQDPKGKLTRVPGETDKWQITMSSIRSYFGLAANVNIYRLCLIFRNGPGTIAASAPLTVPGGQVDGNYDYQIGDLFMNLNYNGTGSTVIPSTTFEYTLPSPLAFQKNYFVKLDAGAYQTAEGVSANLLVNNSDWTFSTRTPPNIATLSPASGASSVSPNPSLAITFSEALTPKAGKNLYLYKSTNLTTPYRTIDVTTATANGAVMTFGLTSPLDFQTQYVVKLDPGAFTTSDGGAVNLLTNNTDWIFTVRNLPTVTSTSPAATATGVSLNPSLAITWSENTTAAVGKKMYVTDQASTSTPLYTIDVTSASIASATSTFSLPGPLNYGATYAVTFDANAFVTIDGGWLSAFTSTGWTFTARNKPAVSSLVPAHQATGVAVKPTITIGFAEAVSAIAGKNLYITEVGKTTPSVTMPLSGATVNGNSLSMTVTTALSFLTQYFITTDPGSFKTTDNVPFSLFTNTTDWLFTSTETPDVEPPAIVYVPPTFIKGGANKIQPTITDNKSVASGTVYYRSITSTGTFTPAALVLNTSTNKWEVAVDDAWLDNMGLNYYIVARDASNNKARLPKDSTVFISNLSFATAPSVPSTVVSFGGQEGNYRIIAIPYILADNKVSTVFNELGLADDTKWRLLTYSKGRGASTEWKEYPASLSTIDRGRGYWINMVSSTSLQIDGATTPANDRSNLFSMTLNPGYNQIGNPYTQDISWADIRKQNSNIHAVQTFKGSWAEDDILKPFEGGFVFVDGTSPITVNFNFKSARTNGHVFDRGTSDLASTNWFLPLSLQQGEITNRIAGVGMNENAANTFDAFDNVSAPSIMDYPKAKFADATFETGGYPIHVVSSQDSYIWNLEIAGSAEEQILLQWDNTNLGENSKDLILWDVASQTAISMRKVNSYMIHPSQGKAFKIYYGTDMEKSIVPDKISLGVPFPNPASASVQIPFTIPGGLSNCSARVEIFDALGKRITVLTDAIYAPGIHQLVWDIGSTSMSNGLYTVHLSVSGDNVQDHKATKLIVSK